MHALKSSMAVLMVGFLVTAASGTDLKDFKAQRRTLNCPVAAKAPVIDGKLNDECWAQAEKAGPFFVLGKQSFATQQTDLRVCRDKDNLYLGIQCRESKIIIAFLRSLAVGPDDAKVFGDDNVEIFFSPSRNHVFYHLAVNSKGALYDCLNDDVKWQSGAAVGTSVGEEEWIIEMRIPLAGMAAVKEDDTWTFNVTRQVPRYEHPAEKDLSTWAYIPPGQGFCTPESFGQIVFKAPDEACRKEAQAYDEAARQFAAKAEAAAQKIDVWTFNRDGIDENAIIPRCVKRGWTMANFWEKTAINQYLTKYNVLLMKSAFAQERLRKLERECFYLDASDNGGKREAALVQPLKTDYEKIEQALNAAFVAYRPLFESFQDKGVIESAQPFDDACARMEELVGPFNDKLAKAEAAVAAEVRGAGAYLMPKNLGPQSRKIPAFTPSGKMNRLVIAGYGGDPFPKVDGEPKENEFELGSIFSASDPDKDTPETIDFTHIRGYIDRAIKTGYDYFATMAFGYHWVTWCPVWFMEAHSNDTDIVFKSYDGLNSKSFDTWYKEENGKLVITDRRKCGSEISLNYHHPAVKELIRKEVPKFVSFYKEIPEVKFYLYGGETQNGFTTDKGWRLTGYGPAARAAFQAWLKNKYGRIKKLNKAWETNYGSFEEIEQPKDPEVMTEGERAKLGVTPLSAEFASFRADAHIEYMKMVYELIKKTDPTRPLCSYFGPPFWKYYDFRGKMMDVGDILELHASSNPLTLQNLYAYSLLRLYPEKGLAYNETHWSYQDEMARETEERAQRAALAKDIYRATTWGRTFQRRWMVMCSSLRCNWYLTDPRMDWTILRYCAPAEITAKRNCEQVDWMITHSTIEPAKILVVDPTATFHGYNEGIQIMNLVHSFMYPQFVYEIYPEEYCLDGRVSLDAYPVIILPSAFYLPPAVGEKLANWVKSGGILIAIGPCGIYNDLGLKNGAFLNGLLGMTLEQQEADIRSKSKELRDQVVGKGKVIYVPHVALIKQPDIDKRLAGLFKEKVVRNVWCENEKFEVVVRKDEGGDLYICILNPDPDKAVTDTVVVPRKLQAAVDVLVPGGCPLKTAEFKRDGVVGTQFQVRLAPADWTVIYAGREVK